MANNAFDAMNGAAGKDMYITGGSIFNSDYENNMSPVDQKEYENTVLGLFQTAYWSDPLAEKYPNVSFKHWLTTIDGDDWRATADDFYEVKDEPRDQFTQEEQIYLIQSLAHLHTGKIEDLIEIVGNLESRGDVGASAVQPVPQGVGEYPQAVKAFGIAGE